MFYVLKEWVNEGFCESTRDRLVSPSFSVLERGVYVYVFWREEREGVKEEKEKVKRERDRRGR